MEYKDVECGLCGARERERLYPENPKQYCGSIVKCKMCSHIYMSPRYELPIDYSDLFNEKMNEEFIKEYIDEKRAKTKTARELLEKMEKYMKPGKLLDVGSNLGFFLQEAHNRKWEVRGVDPQASRVKWCRENLGIEAFHGTLVEAAYPPSSFDSVTFINVVEHLSKPDVEIKEAQRILKENGLLVVEVPNIDSFVARISGKRWRNIVPTHYQYFTPVTMSTLLERNGFHILRISSAPKYGSIHFIFIRLMSYSYLKKSIGMKMLQVLDKTKIGNILVRIDFPDMMRVFARKS